MDETPSAPPARPGAGARHPFQLPWSGWRQALGRAAGDMISDRISLSAAGCAFYATLALFPAISMLVSVYGLAFDPVTVLPQLHVLKRLVPPAAYGLITDRIQVLVSHGTSSLSISLLIGTALAFWSAGSGTKSVLSALNLAYAVPETRSLLRFQGLAFLMTFCAVLGAVLAIATLVALPAAIDFLGMETYEAKMLQVISFSTMVVLVIGALALLYRFGPSRKTADWAWIVPGAVIATVLWFVASALFSYYVGHIASYDATYGPLGAVIGLMLWFYVTAYAILLGAELNAELETQGEPVPHAATDRTPSGGGGGDGGGDDGPRHGSMARHDPRRLPGPRPPRRVR